MKILLVMVLSLFMLGCPNAQSTTTTVKLEISEEPLPAIRHVTDMKVSGDTLLFAFECEDGDGQRFLRRAIIDRANKTINISPDMGKREDGYYASYMPYPFISDNGTIRVIDYEDKTISNGRQQQSAVSSFPIRSGCIYDEPRQTCLYWT